MKASTASATSWTAIAASSRPAIRVTRMVPESPEDAVDDVGEPHRQVEAHVHGDDAERDGHPVGDGLVGLLDEHHGRDDGTGAGQQRRAQRHQGDVDLPVPRRLRLLHLAGQQLHGDEQQEQPAGRLQRGQRDVHVVEQRLPEQGERDDHAERDEDGLPRGPVALLAGHGAREAEEDRDDPGRVHDHEQRDEDRREEVGVEHVAHGRTTSVAPCSSIAASTSGAVRFSPSRLAFPVPW